MCLFAQKMCSTSFSSTKFFFDIIQIAKDMQAHHKTEREGSATGEKCEQDKKNQREVAEGFFKKTTFS